MCSTPFRHLTSPHRHHTNTRLYSTPTTRYCSSSPTDTSRHELAQQVLNFISDSTSENHSTPHNVHTSEYKSLSSSIRILSPSPPSSTHINPSLLRKAISPRRHYLPPITLNNGTCFYASEPVVRRFKCRKTAVFIASLFTQIPHLTMAAGLPPITLSRHDLFHAHIFLNNNNSNIGLLFHSKEYPAQDNNTFPINLGHGQIASTIKYSQHAMSWRSVVWYDGTLAALYLGNDSLLQGLVMEGLEDVYSVLESDFGQPLADIVYLDDGEEYPGMKQRGYRHAQQKVFVQNIRSDFFNM